MRPDAASDIQAYLRAYRLQTSLSEDRQSNSEGCRVCRNLPAVMLKLSQTPDRRQLAPACRISVLWRFTSFILGGHAGRPDNTIGSTFTVLLCADRITPETLGHNVASMR
jgi:hypothetical protein